MKCDDIKLLLHDKELAPDVQQHLDQCADCRRYRVDMEVIMNNPKTFETSEELDNKVLNFARKNRPTEVKKADAKKPIPFFVWSAIAAAAIIVISVLVLNKGDEASDSNDDNIAKKEEIIINKQAPENKLVENEIVKNKQNPEDKVLNKEMVAENKQLKEQEVDPLDRILADDLFEAEMSALESELFVLGGELFE